MIALSPSSLTVWTRQQNAIFAVHCSVLTDDQPRIAEHPTAVSCVTRACDMKVENSRATRGRRTTSCFLASSAHSSLVSALRLAYPYVQIRAFSREIPQFRIFVLCTLF
jgi:hypothetical protein